MCSRCLYAVCGLCATERFQNRLIFFSFSSHLYFSSSILRVVFSSNVWIYAQKSALHNWGVDGALLVKWLLLFCCIVEERPYPFVMWLLLCNFLLVNWKIYFSIANDILLFAKTLYLYLNGRCMYFVPCTFRYVTVNYLTGILGIRFELQARIHDTHLGNYSTSAFRCWVVQQQLQFTESGLFCCYLEIFRNCCVMLNYPYLYIL